MESFEDSIRHSMSDSFSLYERYMRSFNVADSFVEESVNKRPLDVEDGLANRVSTFGGTRENIDLPAAGQIHDNLDKYSSTADSNSDPFIASACHIRDKGSTSLDLELRADSRRNFLAASSLDNLSLNDTDEKSDTNDSKSNVKQPVFITSTMENSNNAVDSVPLFRNVVQTESVFKLPIKELSFNGTIIKHVQKLKPIVDPITALSSSTVLENLEERCDQAAIDESASSDVSEDRSNIDRNIIQPTSESTGDSLYDAYNKKNLQSKEQGSAKWGDQSHSSLEASFDSGVRSPDMFSENEEEDTPHQESNWTFLKDFEAYDKRRIRRIEDRLSGIPPPPSVTTLKTDVNEMLNNYYCYLPAFNDDSKPNPESTAVTPTKRVSFIEIPIEVKSDDKFPEIVPKKEELNTSNHNSSIEKEVDIKLGTEAEAKHTVWPDILKCRYYDVYYNVSCYSEKFELLSLRYGDRYVGSETDTSVNIHSGGLQSPSSASKRKAMRLKMAQAKSPGRRLSHLARRRQAFCSAASIADKSQSSSKMVLIDKNFFPHRKLVNSAERKSPRFKRTPGKKTPTRKTPGKKTPAKTPKSGGSSRKKAMRRLLMEPDCVPRTQPTRETLKRALFLSPENRRPMPQAPSTSVPLQAMKSKRSLFGSPVPAETKSSDGTQSDMFLKRKRDPFDDDIIDRRSKIAKSLSFGGDSIGNSQSHSYSFSRRASETFANKSMAELNEMHKKKLLWAVTEALRVHGWRMSSPGFREKATALAKLTRRLLTLPPHAARLAAPKLSTSDTMLKLARQYVYAIIQGRSVDDCFEEEQAKINNEASTKISGYISASMYQQIKARQSSNTFTSQIKENSCSSGNLKLEQPRSNTKNILQDKTVNIDTNSNSGISALDKMGIFKSNSMPSFEEAAKMRARRQISFDNVDFPKR